MAAPKGNKNAIKSHRIWADAIERAIKQNPKLLNNLALKLIAKAEEGDMAAMREIGDRLDGKPAQALVGSDGGDLKIKSSILSTDTDRFIIQNNGVFQFNNASGTSVATLSSIGDLRTAGSQISNSDNRIKKDIQDIDYGSALQMILAVEPKTYKYVDEERGVSRIYGFIAQQIRNVIPEATEIHKDFLPNIMKEAICNKNRVYLDLTEYTDLPLNEDDRRINIRFKSGGGDNFNIMEVNKEYFVIEKKITNNYGDSKTIICPDGEVFVYGYEVKDFHKLTKDYIFTLNVSATQELHRHIETQNMIIKSYGDRIKELEEKIGSIMKL